MAPGLKLILFDTTCKNKIGFGLSSAWSSGSTLYRALGRVHSARGAATFEEGLGWLSTHRAGEPISEVQFWGHGKWGRIFMARESLDRTALVRGHRHHAALERLRERLAPDALFWFRTCETFGAAPGQQFARAWTDFFGRRAAGHTFIIGYWQSGLHLLEPGAIPHWSRNEGLEEGTADAPMRAGWSLPGQPNTISCLAGRVPSGW
ncbi:MAG TPA: hypothetical protein VGL13_08510 [Polyangiaceae bacterium]